MKYALCKGSWNKALKLVDGWMLCPVGSSTHAYINCTYGTKSKKHLEIFNPISPKLNQNLILVPEIFVLNCLVIFTYLSNKHTRELRKHSWKPIMNNFKNIFLLKFSSTLILFCMPNALICFYRKSFAHAAMSFQPLYVRN